MKRVLLLVICISICISGAGAGAPAAIDKKITIEDALAIKTVGAPQWSPDAKHIAFTMSEWNRKENRRDSHIYLVPASGGTLTKLTNGERGESAPQWSPDGTRIAFLANREARPAEGQQQGGQASRGAQIWVISVSGGEAEKVTDEESGVSQFTWSGDGKNIAFITRDVPKDKADRDKRRRDRFDAIVVDADFTYSHLWTISLGTKEKKRLTEGSFAVTDPQWSPDNRSICYTAGPGGSQESSFIDISDNRNTDLFVVSSAGGPARRVTTNPGPDNQGRWSPDGKQIAYLSSTDPNSWAAKTDVLVIPVDGGAPFNLTRNYHDSVFGGFSWAPDNTTIYAPGAIGVYNTILHLSIKGSTPQPVFRKPGAYGNFDLSPDGRHLAYVYDDGRRPDDIWLANVSGDGAKQLTSVNPQITDFAVSDTEVINWKAADGLDIEGLLLKPVGYESGKRYPLVLQIHGGPYGKFSYGFNARTQIFASNGYAVLMPNPRGSTGYGNRFTTSNLRDWGGKDFQDIMSGVDEVIRKGIADKDRLVVMGGSYGGFMTFWTITQTDRFKAAIGHAAISDWYSFHGQSDVPGLMEYGFGGMPWTARDTYVKYSPMSYVDKVKTPLMITHGEQDRRVPIAQGEQYYRALKKRGVDVVFVRFPREGHGIQEPNHQIDLVKRQLEWFAKYLSVERPEAGGKSATVN